VHQLSRFKFLKSLCWNSPLGCIHGKNSDEEDLNGRIQELFRDGARIPRVSIQEAKWNPDIDMTSESPIDVAWKDYSLSFRVPR
jgi:hypothetical protein